MNGFEGREKAYQIINEAIDLYQKTFVDEEKIEEEAKLTTEKKERKESIVANKVVLTKSESKKEKEGDAK